MKQDFIALNSASAAAQVLEFGLAVAPSRIPSALVTRLCEQVMADMEYISSDSSPEVQASSKGHIVTKLPARRDLLFREVLLDELVLSVCSTLFGPWKRWRLETYQCNVNMPHSQDQELHGDMGQLWPGLSVPPPPHSLIVNIPLVNVNERNVN